MAGRDVGPRLRSERERRLLTQQELAEMSGVSPVTISRIETGLQRPYAATLKKLASALGIDPQWLAWGEE